MTFREFQNRARLYVIGALYPQELAEFQNATAEFGPRGEAYIRECHALHEAFALSLRSDTGRERLNRRVMSMSRRPATA